jgi:predicted acyltransferase
MLLIGIFLINNAYDLENARIFGVMQRLALCYIIVASIVIFIPKNKIISPF